jgi:hypothetical protein
LCGPETAQWGEIVIVWTRDSTMGGKWLLCGPETAQWGGNSYSVDQRQHSGREIVIVWTRDSTVGEKWLLCGPETAWGGGYSYFRHFRCLMLNMCDLKADTL